MQWAHFVAQKRIREALLKGHRNACGLRRREYGPELTGAAAELALALELGCGWTGAIEMGGPDVGLRTQVRSSDVPRKTSHLIVRPRDFELYGEAPFVLVIRAGQEFLCKGWCLNTEAPRLGWFGDGGKNRPDAWFVPEERLRPIEELENP